MEGLGDSPGDGSGDDFYERFSAELEVLAELEGAGAGAARCPGGERRGAGSGSGGLRLRGRAPGGGVRGQRARTGAREAPSGRAGDVLPSPEPPRRGAGTPAPGGPAGGCQPPAAPFRTAPQITRPRLPAPKSPSSGAGGSRWRRRSQPGGATPRKEARSAPCVGPRSSPQPRSLP